MLMNIKTTDFGKMNVYERKRVLSQFFGHKVNQIVSGSLTNGRYGDFRVRHDDIAYSNIRITTVDNGYMRIQIWNFQTEQWQEEDE